MGDEHGGDARLSLDAANLFPHLQSQAGVQIGKGFVQQEDIRPLDQRPCNGHPLLLAAGELPGQAVQLLPQPQVGDHLPDVALVHRAAVQLNGEDDVLIYAEHRHQIIGLEHEADLPPPEDGQLLVLQGGQLPAVHRHRAGGGPVQPAQHVQQGGLARPRRADDSHELAVLHAQLHPVQGFHQGVPRAIIFLQFPGLQNRHLESPPVEKMGTAF